MAAIGLDDVSVTMQAQSQAPSGGRDTSQGITSGGAGLRGSIINAFALGSGTNKAAAQADAGEQMPAWLMGALLLAALAALYWLRKKK